MSLFAKAEEVLQNIEQAAPKNPNEIEQFRISFLGSKGMVKTLSNAFKDIPKQQKKEYGQLLNKIKKTAEEKLTLFKACIAQTEHKGTHDIDLSKPAFPLETGNRHPLAIVETEIINILSKIGYSIATGPELEDDWHNFTALNTPEDHPARDMQDTFYIEKGKSLLRTHTSSVQIRSMELMAPPIRIITPGRVYRNETISARAHCIFHQVEGLYIDKDVSFADLRQTLFYFAKALFGEDTRIRLRPSYFPFTEPSAEMDISCFICNQEGCSVCKQTGWVEIGGCGMVDPAVLTNCDIDPNIYSGFAFGMGIERICMLKYGINDIRLFYENDLRFLKQFKSA